MSAPSPYQQHADGHDAQANQLNLFRSEAITSANSGQLGSIRIDRRLDSLACAAFAILVSAAVILLLLFGQIPRKARAPGILAPSKGLVQINTIAGGTLLQALAQEGDYVEAGQKLFIIDTDRTGKGGSTSNLVARNHQQQRQALMAERSLRELLALQHIQGLTDKRRSLAIEISQSEAEYELSEARVTLAENTLRRNQELASSGFVSSTQVQTVQDQLMEQQTRTKTAQRTTAALKRERADVTSEIQAAKTQLGVDMAQIDRNLSVLAQDETENQAKEKLVVVASRSGYITAIHSVEGSVVQTGQLLANLVPQSDASRRYELIAALYAPSRTAGFAQPGQEVWLKYSSFPYEKFGMGRGVVSSVSGTPISQSELPSGEAQSLLASAQANEPLYRITVVLKGQQLRDLGNANLLKAGMAVDGDLILEHRAIWEWLFEPLLSASESRMVRVSH